MGLTFLLSNWKEITVAFLLTAVVTLALLLKVEVQRGVAASTTLTALQKTIKDSEQNQTKIAELPQVIEKINTKYKDRLVYINTWKGDTNASECENAINKLRGFDYTSGL